MSSRDNQEIYEIISKLKSYVIDDSKYESQLLFCINAELWDLAILVAWKFFMLFIYERLSQINSTAVIQKWDSHFNKSGGKTLSDDVNMENLYWPNEKKDDEVITFIKDLYPIDDNVAKQAQTLLSERNCCSHVSQLDSTRNDFATFLEKIVRILNIIQEKHATYLEEYVNRNGQKLSTFDKIYTLKTLTKKLREAKTFKEAEQVEKVLSNYIGYIDRNSLSDLLIGVLENNCAYNQVLDSNYTLPFLDGVFHKTKNFIDVWKKFSGQLALKGYYEKYSTLISDIDFEANPIPF